MFSKVSVALCGTIKILYFRIPTRFTVNTLKFKAREIFPKGADGIINSVDPDQSPLGGAV